MIVDENNNENKSLIDKLDSEPGYFNKVIRAMLTPGHETELIFWFKNVGLIPNMQICNNATLNENCNKYMDWVPGKTIDYYQWKCRNCSEKKSIKDNSIFQDSKCNLKNAIRILLGWCKGHDIEAMASILGIKKHIVRTLYNAVTASAKKYLKSNIRHKKIGGPGAIVIIDTYPEGCTNNTRGTHGSRPILCIAEAKNIPPLYWFEALERFNHNNPDHVLAMKLRNLQIIQDIVLPGSILVTRLDSTLCSYYDLQSLSHLYPHIVSVEGLARHDNNYQTIGANLETIWQLALDVCEQAQFFSYEQVPNFLVNQMWQARFGSEAFEMLLNCLTQ